MSNYASFPGLETIRDRYGMHVDVADSEPDMLVRLAIFSDDTGGIWTDVYLGPAEADRVASALTLAADLARGDG